MDYLKKRALKKLSLRKKHHTLRTLPLAYTSAHTSAYASDSASTTSQTKSVSWWQEWAFNQAQDYYPSLLNTQEIDEPLNFNTNDYLGLERSKCFAPLHAQLAHLLPLGGLSSRLIGGNHTVISALEKTFAQLFGYETALYFSSGTILGHSLAPLIQSLEHKPQDIRFFSDELNHACTITGMRLAKIPHSHKHIFKHLNFQDLNTLLHQHPSPCQAIFLEALYSMDGDSPKIEDLKQLTCEPNRILIVDEAHSLGIWGKEGKGLISSSLTHPITDHIIGMYPCGKALGLNGAFLSGPNYLIDYAINFAGGFIYTTAPSPMVAASLLCRLYMLKHLQPLRKRLTDISLSLCHQLSTLGYHTKGDGSPILSIILPSNHAAIELSLYLKNHGIYTTAIRPPTVPSGTSRLRLSLHPFLNHNHLCYLHSAFQKAQKTLKGLLL